MHLNMVLPRLYLQQALYSTSSDLTASPCEGISVSFTPLEQDPEKGVLTLTLDKPKRKNALSRDMFAGVPEVLGRAANNEGVRAVVITGGGEYYSSGFDLAEVLVAGKGLKFLTL